MMKGWDKMPIDILMEEAKEMPEESILDVIRYVKWLKLERMPEKKKIRKAGIMEGQFTIPDDFDEPLDDFEGYM